MINKFLLLCTPISTKGIVKRVAVLLYMRIVYVANNPPLLIKMHEFVNWSTPFFCIKLDWHGHYSEKENIQRKVVRSKFK